MKSTVTILIIFLLSLVQSCKEDEPVLPPVLTTTAASTITYTTAISGGNISTDGGATLTTRGVCWSTSHNPTISDSKSIDGTGVGSFTSNITGLTAGISYFVRSYATNSVGTAYGNEVEFKTIDLASPSLTTSTVTAITYTTAISGGNITSDGGAPVTARGVCWSTNHNPTISDSKMIEGTGVGIFTSNMTGLPDGTTHYVRSFATNSVGTAYGNEVEFKTIPISITDGEGNIYYTTIIGTQVWLVENLVATKYRNGDPIPLISENSEWATLTAGAYSNYSNDPANSAIYGKLYNWYAIADSRKIAPVGWHIPSEAEWATLNTYLGDELLAGGKLKETGLTHWKSPNTGATNETGFSALPGGYRDTNGIFSNFGYKGVWWSATEKSINDAYALFTYTEGTQLHGEPNDKNLGFSIRCIMD